MFRWIADNYRTFFWAFALATAVWISSVTSADPDQTKTLSTPVPVQIIGQSSNLIFSSAPPKSVQVTLRAPSSVWALIEDNPSLVAAILDVSGLSAGEHTQELQIQVNARPVQIVSVSPKSTTFGLEPLISKTMNVDLRISGEVATGYQIGDSSMEPVQVIISGAQSQVEKVSRVQASLDLNRTRDSFDQTIKLDVLDQRGLPVNGITVSPDTAHVTIPVSQQGGYRDVAIKVLLDGALASSASARRFEREVEVVGDEAGLDVVRALELSNGN